MQMITKVHSCLFYFLKHHLVYFVCFFAEELFSLGPGQLGCLQDKDKPGAKVSLCAEGCSQKCSLHICNMYGSCSFSEGQSDPTGITETVCQSAAGGPTERLHSQPH